MRYHKSRGRQKQTWIEIVKTQVNDREISLEDVDAVAHSRTKWMNLIQRGVKTQC